jgi:hypothetical protein
MQATSTAVTAQDDKQPSRQAIEAKTRSKPGAVTGKIAAAIDHMIEDGMLWDKAALHVGLTVRAMRLAMQKPHVVAFIKTKREVFRVHASSANIRKLVDLRDQTENKAAAVSAIKVLEQMGDETARGGIAGRDVSPGFVIQVNVNQPPSHAQVASRGQVLNAVANDSEQHQSLSHETALMGHERGATQADEDVLWIDGRSEGDPK